MLTLLLLSLLATPFDSHTFAPAGAAALLAQGKQKKKADFAEQAERTAWKLVQDWVEVQMSMVQLKQADVREVFLAYIWNGRQTFFQNLEQTGFRALLPEKTE